MRARPLASSDIIITEKPWPLRKDKTAVLVSGRLKGLGCVQHRMWVKGDDWKNRPEVTKAVIALSLASKLSKLLGAIAPYTAIEAEQIPTPNITLK